MTKENFQDAYENETVKEYISRKLQFPECHDYAYETFDDMYMIQNKTDILSNYLKVARLNSRFLEDKAELSVTTAAGNRFEVGVLDVL